jgi:hypothetical protein
MRDLGFLSRIGTAVYLKRDKAIDGQVMNLTGTEIWLKGLLAAAVSGGAGGVLTGFAAVGIDPQHFNLQTGMGATLRIAAAAALINAVIGVAAYLQKSPLPEE